MANTHIDQETLIDYAENRADAAVAVRVDSHLRTGCQSCQAQLNFWRRTQTALRADTPPVPAEVRRRAFAIFDLMAVSRPSARSTAKTIFDSRLSPAFSAARGDAAAPFELDFRSDDVDIALLCQANAGRWWVAGRVSNGADPAVGWSVAARLAATESAWNTDATTDPVGAFYLRDMPAGEYELELDDAMNKILIEISLPVT